MINVNKNGIILSETHHEFENDGVLNPAVFQENETVHIFYRAVKRGNISSIGYAKLAGPLHVEKRNTFPLIKSSTDAEKQGIEDPRIVQIESEFYVTYSAYDGKNALGSLVTSKNLIDFEKQGIVVPQISIQEFKQIIALNKNIEKRYLKYLDENEDAEHKDAQRLLWDKNVILFPRKIDGKFFMLHRIKPDIQIVSFTAFSDLTPHFWKNYLLNLEENILLSPKYSHEISYIGGGCPPIETPEGWLIIYHGVEKKEQGNIYSGCVALLDIENPRKELARLPFPLITPEAEWELTGYVNNVVFPSGTAIFDDLLYIYYGAADQRIAVASVKLKELLSELVKHKVSQE